MSQCTSGDAAPDPIITHSAPNAVGSVQTVSPQKRHREKASRLPPPPILPPPFVCLLACFACMGRLRPLFPSRHPYTHADRTVERGGEGEQKSVWTEGGHRSSRGNILVTYADRYCSELEVLNMCGEHFSDYAERTSLDCRLKWGGRLCVL